MKAVWIGGKAYEIGTSAAFALELTAQSGTVLRLAAKNAYQVFINGKFLAFGPVRAAHGHTVVDEFPLGAYTGSAVRLVVEVHAYNVSSFESADDRPFFAAEVSGGGVCYGTDDFKAFLCTDKLRKVVRYSYQRVLSEYYALDYDRRRAFRRGDDAVFPLAATEAADGGVFEEREAAYPRYEEVSGVIYERGTVELDRRAERLESRFFGGVDNRHGTGFAADEFERDTVGFLSALRFHHGTQGTDGVYTGYDLGKVYAGFFKLVFDAADDTEIAIAFDEVLVERYGEAGVIDPWRLGCVNLIRFEVKKGHYELITAEPYTARYAALIVTAGKVENASLAMIRYENPEAEKAVFAFGDGELCEIFEAARRTTAHNAVDIPTDCPSRERGGWLCDALFGARAEMLFTGNNAAERRFLKNYADSPAFDYLPAGMIPMVYPADTGHDTFISNWALWYILQLSDAVKRRGLVPDAAALDKVRGILRYHAAKENGEGLLENLDGWVFVEWSKANDYTARVNYPSNMLYAASLDAAAGLLGDSAYREKAASLREKIRKAKRGIFYVDNAVRENGALVPTVHTTETCQYYAFIFGVASPQTDGELWTVLRKSFGPSRNEAATYPDVPKANAFMGNYLRLILLIRHGYASQAIDECRGYFLFMARRTGTLWEHDSVYASCDHGFAAFAACLLVTAFTGIVGIDGKRRIVLTEKGVTVFPADGYVSLPYAGGFIKVTVKDGVREVEMPEGWQIG